MTEQKHDDAGGASRSDVVLAGYKRGYPAKITMFIEGDGYAMCPFCRGTGQSPTTATTVIDPCSNCAGTGKLRAL